MPRSFLAACALAFALSSPAIAQPASDNSQLLRERRIEQRPSDLEPNGL